MISEKKITLSEILYYIFFSALLFAKGIGLYDGQGMFKILLVIAVAAWAGKMFLTEYTVKEFIIVFLLVLLGGLTYLVSGEKGALLYIFMITGLKNIPIKRVFTVGAVVWTTSFLVLTWLNAAHILEGPFKVHEKLGMDMIIRWGLGYSHPNVLHISYLVFVMFLVYLMGERFHMKHAIGFMIGNIIVFVYSVSSTGVITVTFYLVLALYWRYRKKLNCIENALIQIAFPVCVLFSMLGPLLLKGKAFDVVNNIMNTRLALAKNFLSLHSFTLFGIRLSEITTSQLTMDNSYVFAFVIYGVVLFFVIVLAYLVLVRKYCKEQKGSELCILLASFVAGIMEPFMFNTSFKNISLLFMKEILFKEESERVYHLPGYFSKEYIISFRGLNQQVERIRDTINKRKKLLFMVVGIGVIVGGFGYHIFVQQPERILVPETACDIAVLQRTRETLESLYLPSEQAIPQANDKVIGYVNADTKMIIYTDGIVKMEWIRGVLCSGITTGIITLGVLTLIYGYSDKKGKSKNI